MIDYAYEQKQIVAEFVTRMTPWSRPFGKCSAIGVLEDGKLIAGIVYHNWNPDVGVIEMSGAALPKCGWLTRETIRRMYEYPFDQLGVQMIMKLVPADNEHLLRQLAIGDYMFIRVPRLMGRDRDAVLCLLTREAWQACKLYRRHLVELKEAA